MSYHLAILCISYYGPNLLYNLINSIKNIKNILVTLLNVFIYLKSLFIQFSILRFKCYYYIIFTIYLVYQAPII